jgi:hypothetical protein
MLLYDFASKEELVMAVLAEVRRRGKDAGRLRQHHGPVRT